MKKQIYIYSFILIILIIYSPFINADFQIIINFDDGYEGVYKNAFPIMQEYNIPGVVFVITKELDRDRHLSVEQLKILKNSGWEIGSHSVCHYDLTQIIPSVLVHEISGSKKHLDDLELLDDSYSSFSSPNERWNPEIKSLVSTTYQLARAKNLFIFKDNNIYTEKSIHKVVVKSTTLKQVVHWIKEAKKKEQPLILIFHEIATGGNDLFYSPDNFRKLINKIKDFKITTFKQFYNSM